jgi:hypothetical protein
MLWPNPRTGAEELAAGLAVVLQEVEGYRC